MSLKQIHAESLLGRRVRALNGRVIGRLEEIRVREQSRGWYVEEYLIGQYALLERLAGSSISRAVLAVFGGLRKKLNYGVPWDKLDLSDPQRPRLLCDIADLSPIEIEE